MPDHETAHGHGGPAETEPDTTSAAGIGAAIAITAALLVIFAWGLHAYFMREAEETIHRQVLDRPSAALELLRDAEKTALTTAGTVDPAQAIYRIPIDQAMALFVREANARAAAGEPQRIGPVVPAPGAPAEPTPGAAGKK